MARVSKSKRRWLVRQYEDLYEYANFFGCVQKITLPSGREKIGPRKLKRFSIYNVIPRVRFNGIRDTSTGSWTARHTTKDEVGLDSIVIPCEKGPQ